MSFANGVRLQIVRVSPQLQEVLKSCERTARFVWWNAVVVAIVFSALALVLQGEGWTVSPRPATALALIAMVAVVPHLILRLALSRRRLAEWRRRAVDLNLFADESDKRTVLTLPVRVQVRLRRPIERTCAAAVPESERSLLNVARAATRWSIVRVNAMLFGSVALILLVDPSSLGLSRGSLVALCSLLMATCFPRVVPWISKAASF